MKYSFALSAALTLTSFLGFSQEETTVNIEHVRSAYRGCTVPVDHLRPTSCSAPIRMIESPSNFEETENSSELLDITDPEMIDFAAAPNPSKGFLMVTVPPVLIGREITVYDMTGRQVGFPVQITGVSQPISIEGETGVYLISIQTEKQVLTKRILHD